MSDNENENKKGFQVVDRRFWADESEEGSESGPTPDKPSYVMQLERELAEKKELLQQYITQHKESVSEFEGARARIRRDTSKEIERARRSLLGDFIEVLDNLELALQAAEEGQDLSAVLQGVMMVRDLFVGKLANLGVTRIDAVGSPFDPKLHEAITTVPAADPEMDGRVVGVIRDGYIIGEELLRPATVAVAQGPTAPANLKH